MKKTKTKWGRGTIVYNIGGQILELRPDFISQLSTKEGRNCGSKSHCKNLVTVGNSKFGQSRKERWRKHN